MKNYEIERKFLLDIGNIPYDFSKLDALSIEQGYILYNPEVRVRSVSDSEFYMTMKESTESDLVRKEVELPISANAYSTLINNAKVNKLKKNRYKINDFGKTLEIDLFEGKLKGLACMEVEFENEKEANEFNVPAWVTKEVTNDLRYRSSALAQGSIQIEN